MNRRLFLTSFFLGILTAFVVWAFRWTLDSWEEVPLDMPGEVTVLGLTRGPQAVGTDEAESAQEELKAYLRDQFLALIVSSSGEGRPEVLVYDPHGLVPWFPGCPPDAGRSGTVPVWLFRGTYSEHLWTTSAPNPFLPQGAVVKGIVAPPRGAGSLQYVRCVGRDLLPEGRYIFNTTDSTKIQHILNLLYRMGFVHQTMRKPPFFLYLMQDPLMGTTAFFLIAGYGCVVLYWLLYLRGRSREFGLRGRHGSLPADLLWENFVGGLPGLGTGSGLGGGLAGILVAAIGQVPLSSEDLLTLAIAIVVTATVTAVTWLIVLYGVIRARYEANLAG